MITRIEVDGFKSLQNFALDLEPFTAFVGPNGAGKSNILDALALLSRIASGGDLATALQGGRGRIREQFSTIEKEVIGHDHGTRGVITFGIEVLLLDVAMFRENEEVFATRLRYEVAIERQLLPSGVDRYVFRRDQLTAISSSNDRWMDKHPKLHARAAYLGEQSSFLSSYENGERRYGDPSDAKAGAVGHTRTVVPLRQGSHLSDSTRAVAAARYLNAVAYELRDIQIAHFEPKLLREPSEPGAPAMTAEGAYLPTALARLPPESLGRVRARLVEMVPGVRMLDVVVAEDLQAFVELTDGRRFSSRVLSDGTLRVLGLLTLLESSTPGGVLAIEEPENGVHPSRANELVRVFRDAAASNADGEPPRQVLITSHSLVVLAALMNSSGDGEDEAPNPHGPDELVFIDMVRVGLGPRRTRARRIANGVSTDRGEFTVSHGEVQRLLALASVSDRAGGGP